MKSLCAKGLKTNNQVPAFMTIEESTKSYSSNSSENPTPGSDKWWPGVSVPRFLASTAIVTVLQTTAFHPVGVIKVKLQVNAQPQHISKAFVSTAEKLVVEHGWQRGLFRGLTFACTAAIPMQYSYIFAYNSSLKQLERHYDMTINAQTPNSSNDSSSSSNSRHNWVNIVPRALLPAIAGAAADLASTPFRLPQVQRVVFHMKADCIFAP